MKRSLTTRIHFCHFLAVVMLLHAGCRQHGERSNRFLLAMGISPPSAPHVVRSDLPDDPLLVCADIDKAGQLSIAGTRLRAADVGMILDKVCKEYGTVAPVMFRADGESRFSNVWHVVCMARDRGLFRFAFAVCDGPPVAFFVQPPTPGFNKLAVDGSKWSFNAEPVDGVKVPRLTIHCESSRPGPVEVSVSGRTAHRELMNALDALFVSGYRLVVLSAEQ